MNKTKICPYGFHSNEESECDCGEKVSMKHTIQEENWSKELEELFHGKIIFPEHKDILKNAIERVFASKLQSIKDEIEKKYKSPMTSIITKAEVDEFRDNLCYNKALSDVESIISNRMGEK